MAERKRFGLEELDSVLRDVSGKLGRVVEVYLIGGLAMMRHGLKATTKDVDLVFIDAVDEREFETALLPCGFQCASDIPECYKALEATTIMDRPDGMRFDMFVGRVCRKLRLTDGMRRRATRMDLEGHLQLMVMAPEDVFLLKSVTDRDDDLADMALLAGKVHDWRAMLDELRSDAENYRYLPHLSAKLAALEDGHGIVVPGRRQLERESVIVLAINILEGHMRDGPLTLPDATRHLGEGDEFSISVLDRMVELELIREEDGVYVRVDADPGLHGAPRTGAANPR